MTKREMLQAIDAIECRMRQLEGSLTSLRERIYADSGLERIGIGMDGHPKKSPEQQATDAFMAEPPF